MTSCWASKGKTPVHGNPGGQVLGKQDDMTSESELVSEVSLVLRVMILGSLQPDLAREDFLLLA